MHDQKSKHAHEHEALMALAARHRADRARALEGAMRSGNAGALMHGTTASARRKTRAA